MINTFAQKVLDYHFTLPTKLPLTKGVEMIYPFAHPETISVMTQFFHRYYHDSNPRHFIFGINPGRFGSGITGVGFTDAAHLESHCGIKNSFSKRVETSSEFIYEVIEAYGGTSAFYKDFYITSVSPVGFTKEGNNYNYYDDKALRAKLEKFIIHNIQTQLNFGQKNRDIICIGQGKNLKYLQELNKRYTLFDTIHALPHPRWVMQYKRKEKSKHIDAYLEVFEKLQHAS